MSELHLDSWSQNWATTEERRGRGEANCYSGRSSPPKSMASSNIEPNGTSASKEDIEFHSMIDDAWYSVETVLDGTKLIIKYRHFGDEENTMFDLKNFKSLEEIEDFKGRFRPGSIQLQDSECERVTMGMVVCASHSFFDSDILFYDAVVDDVIRMPHSFTNGEQECTCTFVLSWQHGPAAGCLVNKKVENICIIQPHEQQLDARLSLFCNKLQEKFKNGSHLKPSSSPNGIVVPTTGLASGRRCSRPSPSFPSLHAQAVEASGVNGEETDMGGDHHCRHVVFISNLDKHLLPSSIAEFLREQTSVAVEAYVFPSLAYETHTMGAVVMDCKENVDKLCKFLDNPNHIVASHRGRSC